MEIIVIGLIVITAIYYTYSYIRKEISGEGSCHCSSCPANKKSGCSSNKKDESE